MRHFNRKNKLKKSELRAWLRKTGIKVTTPRLAVLDLMRKHKNPLSAQEIIGALKGAADPATVYRILKVLKSKGVIVQVDLRHNHAHYELANKKEHHHLICLGCGLLEEVHQCDLEEMYQVILKGARHFSEIRKHALEFYGLCRTCLKREEKGELAWPKHKTAPF